MKKLIYLALSILVVSGWASKAGASAIFGNQVRLDSMSTDGREVEDMGLIWTYANKALEYKNTSEFNLGNLNGGGTQEWGGLLIDTEGAGVWGFYVNRPAFGLRSEAYILNDIYNPIVQTPWQPIGGIFGDVPINNTFDLFWAQPTGLGDLGLRLSYGEIFQTTGTEVQAETWRLSAGLGTQGLGPFQEANFHLDLGKATGTQFNPSGNDAGIYTLALGTLMSTALADQEDMRVFADVELDQTIYPPANLNDSDGEIDLGTALVHKFKDGKGLVSTGLVLDYLTGKLNDNTATLDDWLVLWNCSVERQVADWLTLRAGLAAPLVARAYYTGNTPTYTSSASGQIDFSTGFGITWENFILDGSIKVSSLENSINNVQPGNGLLFTNGTSPLQVLEADLKYKY
jgi:hypothetical protein